MKMKYVKRIFLGYNSIDERLPMKKRKENKEYQIINARYKLSFIQTKILIKVISLINTMEDSDFMSYQLPLSFFDFLKEHNTPSHIRKECKELKQKSLSIEIDGDWIETSWFSSFAYRKSLNIIEVKIDPNLKPYLLQLKKKFKPYEIKYVLSMESEYAIRIYELCKQNENTFTKKEFELTELRELMQVPQSYKKQYIDFRVKVLDIAVREINKHSDILLSYEAKKHGRAVFSIEFSISKNEKNILKEEILESAIQYDEKVHKEFNILFKKFGFNESEFGTEFKNFCLYNNDIIEEITIKNFTKWCMQKKRKTLEKNHYNWNFKKAKESSDRLKDWFMFEICFDWQEKYYGNNIKTFEYQGIHYAWQKVIHPTFEKEKILLFIVEEDLYLAKNDLDIINVEIN